MYTLASASGNVFAFVWKRFCDRAFDGQTTARRICPKGSGLGLDGLFVLGDPVLDSRWTIEHWDADGSRTFCSNGTRAAVALLPERFTGTVEVCSSDEIVALERYGSYVGLRLPEGQAYKLSEAPKGLAFPAVYAWTGTPHLILQVPDVDLVDLPTFAPPLRFHAGLPQGANVSILQILSPSRAKIRSWERGVEGETLSCGQGAAAAAAWLAEQTGVNEWEIFPKGIDSLRLNIANLDNRHWTGLWLRGQVRILGNIELGPALR